MDDAGPLAIAARRGHRIDNTDWTSSQLCIFDKAHRAQLEMYARFDKPVALSCLAAAAALLVVGQPCLAASSAANCSQSHPFMLMHTADLVRFQASLTGAVQKTNVQYLEVNVQFTDELGRSYEAGGCPEEPPYPATDIGLPLLWFVKRAFGVWQSVLSTARYSPSSVHHRRCV